MKARLCQHDFKIFLHPKLQGISVLRSSVLFLTVGLLYWTSRGDRSDLLVKAHSLTLPPVAGKQLFRSKGLRRTWSKGLRRTWRKAITRLARENVSCICCKRVFSKFSDLKIVFLINNRLFCLNETSLTVHFCNIHSR